MVYDQLAPVDLRSLHDAPFQGRLDITTIGQLPISHLSHTPQRTEGTADSVRRHGRHDRVYAVFRLAGRETIQQGDQEAVTRAGDFVIIDARPAVTQTETGSALVLNLPRDHFEALLGPSRLFSALTVGASLASTTLTNTYIRELVRLSDRLTPDTAARMASIGIDLIVASLIERTAQEVPRSIHGNVTVQRAKAHIEANLSDANLDPPQLAAAMGVSLRRLQELFQERDRHISDYIWDRRLAAAAKRLADPACGHLSVGMLAYGCGFSSHAHFARRFKDRFGMSPREYRRAPS